MDKLEIDHTYTREIVCPYCGYAHGDSWEIEPNEGEMNCHQCEKEFSYSRDVTVEYSTERIEVK